MCLEECAVEHGSCGKMNDQVTYLFLDIYYRGNKICIFTCTSLS